MSGFLLNEHFDANRFDPRLAWLNEPPAWRIETASSRLVVETGEGTDFWQRTHYGFRADSGHFLGAPVEGDFDAEISVCFHPRNQYDQAGLMIRSGPESWIKASVEYEPDGPSHLGAVVTRSGYSDWSMQEFPESAREILLYARRRDDDFELSFRLTGNPHSCLMRIAHLDGTGPLACGIYACSPKGSGFRAEFDYLLIR
jgi:uncharacterized protein